MIAPLLLFIAARSMMSCALRLKLKPGLGVVPHPMMHQSLPIRTPVRLPQTQMRYGDYNPGSAADRRQARFYGPGPERDDMLQSNASRMGDPTGGSPQFPMQGRMRDDKASGMGDPAREYDRRQRPFNRVAGGFGPGPMRDGMLYNATGMSDPTWGNDRRQRPINPMAGGYSPGGMRALPGTSRPYQQGYGGYGQQYGYNQQGYQPGGYGGSGQQYTGNYQQGPYRQPLSPGAGPMHDDMLRSGASRIGDPSWGWTANNPRGRSNIASSQAARGQAGRAGLSVDELAVEARERAAWEIERAQRLASAATPTPVPKGGRMLRQVSQEHKQRGPRPAPPAAPSPLPVEIEERTGAGKSFDDDEATRDADATVYRYGPNSKQQDIPVDEDDRGSPSARTPTPLPEDDSLLRQVSHEFEQGSPSTATPAAPLPRPGNIEVNTGAGNGFGGGEARRDAEATVVDPQESFDEYIDRAEPVVDDQAADELRARRLMSSKRRAARLAKVPLERLARHLCLDDDEGCIVVDDDDDDPPSALPLPGEIDMQTGAGKGFGGGEATRNPDATVVNPADPKGKQQAIHKAESFAEYLARRASW